MTEKPVENEAPYLNWKVIFLLIAAAVLLGLLVIDLIFHFFSQTFFRDTYNTKGNVLTAQTQSSPDSSPKPPVSPNPTSMITPSPVSSHSSSVSPILSPNSSAFFVTDSFEDGLRNWQTIGDVSVINQLKNPDSFTKPYSGNFMLRIGKPENQGNPLSQNVAGLRIQANANKLSFVYNFFSYDYAGFDEPGFTVSIDDTVVFQKKAAEIDQDSSQTLSEQLDTSHWQIETVDLSQFTQEKDVILTFRSGNDDLNLPASAPHQSWVYLDSIKIE